MLSSELDMGVLTISQYYLEGGLKQSVTLSTREDTPGGDLITLNRMIQEEMEALDQFERERASRNKEYIHRTDQAIELELLAHLIESLGKVGSSLLKRRQTEPNGGGGAQ